MCSACRKCSALDAIQSVFNAAIPQMEVFITYLYPDIICRGWLGGDGGGYTLHAAGAGAGAGRGRDSGDLAILSPAARSISQAPVGSRYTQHSAPCQPRSVYRDTVSCQSQVPATARGVKHKVVIIVGTIVETCILHSAALCTTRLAIM